MDRTGYLAGLFDGEGCITISRYRHKNRVKDRDYYYVRLTVSNKNKPVIDLFKDTFGCGCLYQDKRSGVWEWSLTSSVKGQAILKSLLPFLIVRRKQALAALTFKPGSNGDCEVLKERIHELNHR